MKRPALSFLVPLLLGVLICAPAVRRAGADTGPRLTCLRVQALLAPAPGLHGPLLGSQGFPGENRISRARPTRAAAVAPAVVPTSQPADVVGRVGPALPAAPCRLAHSHYPRSPRAP